MAIDGVHIILTCREKLLGSQSIHWLYIDSLKKDESLELLNNYRKLNTTKETETAKIIVEKLNGYTIGLTIIGVLLRHSSHTLYVDILSDLKNGGIEFLDMAGKNTNASLPGRYLENVISTLFHPLLAKLDDKEKNIVIYASLMAPDHIPLFWLKELISIDFPDFLKEPQFISLLGDWQKCLRKLQSLALFEETANPQIGKMHRLLQTVLVQESLQTSFDERILKYVKQKIEELEKNEKYNNDEIQSIYSYLENRINENRISEDVINYSNWIVSIFISLGRYSEAKVFCRKIAYSLKKISMPEDLKNTIYNNLALVSKCQGNFKFARRLYRLIIKKHQLLPISYELLVTKYNLGTLELKAGNYQDACYILEDVLGQLDCVLNEESNSQSDAKLMFVCSKQLVSAYKFLGDWKAAEATILLALKKWDNGQTQKLDIKVDLHLQYCNLYAAIGDYELALSELEIAKDIIGQHFEGSGKLAKLYQEEAFIWLHLGDIQKSELFFFKAITEIEKENPENPFLSDEYAEYALILAKLGLNEKGEEYLCKSIENIILFFGNQHPSLAIQYSNLSVIIMKDYTRLEEARDVLLMAIEIDKLHYPSTHYNFSYRYMNLVTISEKLGNLTEVKELLKKVLIIEDINFKKRRTLYADTLLKLAEIEFNNDIKTAEYHVEEAIRIIETNIDKPEMSIWSFYHLKFKISYANNNISKAYLAIQNALFYAIESQEPIPRLLELSLSCLDCELIGTDQANIKQRISECSNYLESIKSSEAYLFFGTNLFHKTSQFYIICKDWNLSRYWAVKNVTLVEKRKVDDVLALTAYYFLGFIDFQLNNIHSAKDLFLKALKIECWEFHLGLYDIIGGMYFMLAHIEKDLNNIMTSCYYAELAYKISLIKNGHQHDFTISCKQFLRENCI